MHKIHLLISATTTTTTTTTTRACVCVCLVRFSYNNVKCGRSPIDAGRVPRRRLPSRSLRDTIMLACERRVLWKCTNAMPTPLLLSLHIQSSNVATIARYTKPLAWIGVAQPAIVLQPRITVSGLVDVAQCVQFRLGNGRHTAGAKKHANNE
jgi:hypothetical protein